MTLILGIYATCTVLSSIRAGSRTRLANRSPLAGADGCLTRTRWREEGRGLDGPLEDCSKPGGGYVVDGDGEGDGGVEGVEGARR